MKQVLQKFKTGELEVVESFKPQVRPNSVLVRTLFSAISAGTEKAKLDTGRLSLIGKARARPDLVKRVMDKVKREGLISTFQTVQKKMEEPAPLGYSSVGIVEEVGEWVEGIQPGDYVACAGAGYANHSEYNVVPSRLVAKCPPNTPIEQAAFTTIGSIALQSLRQANPQLGEKIVVIGMGLIGQILTQLLRLNGCQVFCLDLDPWKLKLAKGLDGTLKSALANEATLGAQILDWTSGHGADAVIITASTSANDNGPISQAGELCREKGRVIIVGSVGTQFPREPYYLKEIDIRLSRSYGAGRYDTNYEELGLDYPYAYVRFTEQRNMESFLELLADKKLDLSPLITHRFQFSECKKAFELLTSKDPETKYLGIALKYGNPPGVEKLNAVGENPIRSALSSSSTEIGIGFIGLGNYASQTLIPILKKQGAILKLKAVATSSGVSAALKSKQLGFESHLENASVLLEKTDINTIFITTRHDTHAQFASQALLLGKNVFLEKPICLSHSELSQVKEAFDSSGGVFSVGFNRRFAPMAIKAKSVFGKAGVEHLIYRVNAGVLPVEHWIKIPEVGGGRVMGEACHFFDFAQFACESLIHSVMASSMTRGRAHSSASTEDVHIQLKMQNGALVSIFYCSGGSPKLSKEYFEMHGRGQSVCVEDFKSLVVNGKMMERTSRMDKGQAGLVEQFLIACQKKERALSPISVQELWNSAAAVLSVSESLNGGKIIYL